MLLHLLPQGKLTVSSSSSLGRRKCGGILSKKRKVFFQIFMFSFQRYEPQRYGPRLPIHFQPRSHFRRTTLTPKKDQNGGWQDPMFHAGPDGCEDIPTSGCLVPPVLGFRRGSSRQPTYPPSIVRTSTADNTYHRRPTETIFRRCFNDCGV